MYSQSLPGYWPGEGEEGVAPDAGDDGDEDPGHVPPCLVHEEPEQRGRRGRHQIN